MDGDEYRTLVDRCLRLEAGQDELRNQLTELTLGSGSPWRFPGVWKTGAPYRRVLELMGSAVFVSSVSSLQIVYWNPTAETLYGWKENEVIEQSERLLVAEEDYHRLQFVMDKLKAGRSWSGQFPLKKKSGEILMTMMTKSLLYEDGELSGFITMSNDSAILSPVSPKIVKPEGDRPSGLPRPRRVKFRQISWNSKPLLLPVPIPPSVSNVASKVLPRKFGESMHECDKCTAGSNSDATGLAVKFLEKLLIKDDRNQEKDGESFDVSNSSSGENHKRTGSSSLGPVMASGPELPNGSNECDHLHSGSLVFREVTEVQNSHVVECVKVTVQEQKNDNAIQSLGESVGGHDSSSSKGDNDPSAGVDCQIQWDDLQLGEVIGQGQNNSKTLVAVFPLAGTVANDEKCLRAASRIASGRLQRCSRP